MSTELNGQSGAGVTTEVHANDYLYKFVLDYYQGDDARARREYLSSARNSATVLADLLQRHTSISPDQEFTLLEFASGYGAVTRHLKSALPNIQIVAADIHPQAVEFITQEIAVRARLSTAEPENFDLQERFDVVFALSFFSHMPKNTFSRWLQALYDHVKPGGFLIFTTHGQISNQKRFGGSVPYDDEGFYFHPSSEQLDLDAAEYGTSVCRESFVRDVVQKRLGTQAVSFLEGHWWEHQDAFVIKRPRPETPNQQGHVGEE